MKKTWTTPGGTCYRLSLDMMEDYNILIAGTVGSGKSTVINDFIYSVMAVKTPGISPYGGALVLIDPKRLELSAYRKLPHCIGYGQTVDEAVWLLDAVIREIDARYKYCEKKGLRRYDKHDIYVIIDELADLMITGRKKVLPRLQKILQIGRAAKVHLICGTQSPSRVVIPAELQVNFTARIGLKCSSAIESRQAIGKGGAESLPRYHYIYTSGTEGYTGEIPLTSDADINERIAYWLNQ